MKEYDVKITETLEKTVTVQAESRDAAEEQVKDAYYNSEHILDAENFTGVQFGTQAEREIQKEQTPMMDVLLVRPNMYPQPVQIGCELEDLQKAVGGDIQAVYSKKFFEEHREELILHKAAKQAFDQLDEKKVPSRQALHEEFNQLLIQKKKDYSEYRQVKKDMQEYLIAKQTVETILNIDKKKEQEKKPVR